jgi:hypothetical protein
MYARRLLSRGTIRLCNFKENIAEMCDKVPWQSDDEEEALLEHLYLLLNKH